LTDEKSGQNNLRSIFNPTHHFVLLCLDFLPGRMAFVRKCCGGKFGRSVLVDSLPKLIFGTSRYVSTLKPSQLNQLCRHNKGENHGVGNYSTPEKNPPRPLESSPASRRPVTLAAFALPAAAAFGGKKYTVNKLAIKLI